ncbi:hypothetical protein [Streptomyces sp. NPDC001985]|uniref:hypothetical protein n=1 Tax=Streptomyces sp. NPDC001985 TaxID=3154406 RepID=UPI003321131F
MGIESDQLVYDYLSRVGDLAQRQQLPSAARMELVAALRGEIDRQRGRGVLDSPAAVRRILGRIGSPDEVVASARGGAPAGADAPAPEPGGAPGASRGRRGIPRPRPSRPLPRLRKDVAVPPRPAGGLSPHVAGLDELGSSDTDTDWWSVEPRPFGPGERVAGFTGGVEIPEILAPPPRPPVEEEPAPEEAGQAGAAGPRGLLSRLRRRAPEPAAEPAPAPEEAPAPRRGWGSPLLLLAAALLVGGALFGSWIALGLGWLLVYGSRRLSAAETKTAVFALPGAAVGAGALWVWGRAAGEWGDSVPEGGVGEAVAGTWPWSLKGAALASALYVTWRSRR